MTLAGSTSGGQTLAVGDGVSGTGIAPGTTVAAIVGSALTLSKATTAAVTNTKALVFTATDATFTSLVYDFGNSATAAAELLVGQSVSGSNVELGTTVTSVDAVGKTLLLSKPPTAQLGGFDVITFMNPKVTKACNDYPAATGFTVTFIDVVGVEGDMPLMVPDNSGLRGNKRVTVAEELKGYAGLSGTFRLSFAGSQTDLIPYSASATELKGALEGLDSIPVGGIAVSGPEASLTHERMWRVTFTSPGGDVEAMVSPPYHMHLRGNGASLVVHTDGTESAFERRGTPSSTKGNQVCACVCVYVCVSAHHPTTPPPHHPTTPPPHQLGGTFQLSLLGHSTEPIDFNAPDTAMKQRLEALPNIGTVDVVRSSPTSQLGYTWTVTYTSNPGTFPAGSGNVEALVSDVSALTGAGVSVTALETNAGSEALGGKFQRWCTKMQRTLTLTLTLTPNPNPD